MHTMCNKQELYKLQQVVSSCVNEILELQIKTQDFFTTLNPEHPELSNIKYELLRKQYDKVEYKLLKCEAKIPHDETTHITHLLIQENKQIISNQRKLLLSVKGTVDYNIQKRIDARQALKEAETVLFQKILKDNRNG